MKKITNLSLTIGAVLTVASASAEIMDRPMGIPIGQRMTLKPYVSVSTAYDSNIEGKDGGKEDVMWLINPGLGLEYKADSWMLLANVFYQYADYMNGGAGTTGSYQGYGEDVTYRWMNSKAGEKGWTLMLTEKYQKTDQADDIIQSSGNSYGQDRDEFKGALSLDRRFTSKLHANLNTSYYWLDYESKGSYGWTRWLIGGEAGYAFSPWTDFLVSGSYNKGKHDNASGKISDDSEGETLQVGIGTYATERISYRGLVGWTRYEYGGSNGHTSDGATYTVSGRWVMSETWNMMLMGSSYYQSAEREQNSSQRVDALSWGIAHSMIRGKLSATGDIAYRRETHEYSESGSYDYDLDTLSYRLGLNYTMNRLLTFFMNAEYRQSISDTDSARGKIYDYDRYRLTLGVRFTY